jgi:hypothetical protein
MQQVIAIKMKASGERRKSPVLLDQVEPSVIETSHRKLGAVGLQTVLPA